MYCYFLILFTYHQIPKLFSHGKKLVNWNSVNTLQRTALLLMSSVITSVLVFSNCLFPHFFLLFLIKLAEMKWVNNYIKTKKENRDHQISNQKLNWETLNIVALNICPKHADFSSWKFHTCYFNWMRVNFNSWLIFLKFLFIPCLLEDFWNPVNFIHIE